MFLLDTNVISEFRKAKSPNCNKNFLKWAKTISLSSAFLSAITILELEVGVLLVERRDPTQGAILRTWLNEHVLTTFVDRVLPVDVAVAQRCAKIHIPDPKSERDALIAATALVHGLTVITRNEKDFGSTGIDVFNPFV